MRNFFSANITDNDSLSQSEWFSQRLSFSYEIILLRKSSLLLFSTPEQIQWQQLIHLSRPRKAHPSSEGLGGKETSLSV